MNYEQVTDSIYRFPDQDQGDPVQALWRMQNETRLQAREANKHTQDH
jgi:lipoprotein NlpI